MLIESIEGSLLITDEGRKKLAEAARELETLETELRVALASASARVNVASAATGDR